MNFNSTSADKLKQQAKRLVEEQQFDSIAWCLVQNKTILSSGIESGTKVVQAIETPIYRIYSMTKPIVSFVAMQFISENKLKLSDKVSDFIPSMGSLEVVDISGNKEPVATPITIEHLLTHTAGFSYDFLPDCLAAQAYRDVDLSGRGDRSLAEYIEVLSTLPLASQPGSQWRYSVATDVLAHVLEKVADINLPELLNECVFGPLGMHNTAFHVPDHKVNQLLPMYGAKELGQVMVDSDAPNTLTIMDVEASYPHQEGCGFYRGGHGLFSTTCDYSKFMRVLQTGESIEGQRLIDTETFELMWGDKIADSLKPLTLGFNVLGGYGWNLMGRVMQDPTQCEFKTVSGEGGWAGAASTYFWIDRDNDMSGIVMSQYLGSNQPLGALMHHAGYSMFSN